MRDMTHVNCFNAVAGGLALCRMFCQFDGLPAHITDLEFTVRGRDSTVFMHIANFGHTGSNSYNTGNA